MTLENSFHDWNYIWGLRKLLFWLESDHLYICAWTLPAIASAVCVFDAPHTFLDGLYLIHYTDDGEEHT